MKGAPSPSTVHCHLPLWKSAAKPGVWTYNICPMCQHWWWHLFSSFFTLGMGSIFTFASKTHASRYQGWSCNTSSCGLTYIWLFVIWFWCLLSPCFKTDVWLGQDKGTRKSLQELKISPEPWETLRAQRVFSGTQDKIRPKHCAMSSYCS